MRVLHFDCFSGTSGDMTLGALLDLGVDERAVRAGIDSLGLPIRLEVNKIRKGGFAATEVRVEVPEETSHRFLPDIEAILSRGKLTEKQRDLTLRVFRRLAEAEAEAHGLPLEKVHFHEVGALDSIADIAGAAIALDLLGIDHFSSRSVPTGSGMVKCAHGLMPVPAPATANLLKGVPLATSTIKAELTTPTGAAILTTFVNEWIDAPALQIDRIGHGAGRREFVEQPNILRLFLGTVQPPPHSEEYDTVWMLETNLDDVPGEIIGFVSEELFGSGALDVFTTPVQMKKGRPAVVLSVLTTKERIPFLERILFRETGTLGIRRHAHERSKLQRKPVWVETPWGKVRGKHGWRSDGISVFSPEYGDCAQAASNNGVTLAEVYNVVRQEWERLQNVRKVGESATSPP